MHRYSEYVLVPYTQVLPVPRGVDLASAAGIMETFCTVWYNLFLQSNTSGERLVDRHDASLLVHGGSSGIGTAAIQLCSALGIRVYATAGSARKCRACSDLGATKCFNYNMDDWAGEVSTSGGVDVVLDMVCASYLERNLQV